MTLPAAETGCDRRIIKWLGGYALLTVAFMFAGGSRSCCRKNGALSRCNGRSTLSRCRTMAAATLPSR
ncbi:hypothetical protein SGGMMB4_05462 [Sodalis glossinidius str. 'morsitans']|uniref:Uncharacterized protein n=1 Tax=Sodalis glossinidius (strain morsitans) TaxID=343509 RepID=A0A193QP08_SODGM|nr:hypothetical protein SGGMMB4_05462 [Sodalis glossinidius str. 'morsitans']